MEKQINRMKSLNANPNLDLVHFLRIPAAVWKTGLREPENEAGV